MIIEPGSGAIRFGGAFMILSRPTPESLSDLTSISETIAT